MISSSHISPSMIDTSVRKIKHAHYGEKAMTTIHITTTTPVAPELVLNALTNFTPQRLEIWPNIDPRYYEVHEVHDTSADVTEGSAFFGGVWERAHYDWSQSGFINITVQSSNTFATGSFWKYHIIATENGGSNVELTLRRVGKNLKGFVLETMLRIFGRRIFQQSLKQTLEHLATLPSVGRG